MVSTRHPFDIAGALRTARGFHAAAGSLEIAHRTEMRGPRPSIGDAEIERDIGLAAGATVLEALALEILLKAKLHQAGTRPGKVHGLAGLFALLPAAEQEKAERQYQARRRYPFLRTSLKEALMFHNDVFTKWRYWHEATAGVAASGGELQLAFTALSD